MGWGLMHVSTGDDDSEQVIIQHHSVMFCIKSATMYHNENVTNRFEDGSLIPRRKNDEHWATILLICVLGVQCVIMSYCDCKNIKRNTQVKWAISPK